MRNLITLFTAILGGACSSASTRTAATADGAAGPSARTREHEHAGAHGSPGGAEAHHAFADANVLTQVFDDPKRDEWQRPDDVLRALELEPGMTVADVGAGTGYFAVRLARAVPGGEVLATDLEPNMVRFLRERARREQLPNLRPIQATATASGLVTASVHRILVVHVWHHLPNRGEFARGLASALRPDGKLVIVDFSPNAHRGPPASLRVAPETVVAELEGAGLSARISSVTLPDQYIVEARRRLIRASR